jgi:hypothetical protein
MTSTSTSTAGRSPASRARPAGAGTALTRPPHPGGTADRGTVPQEPVPPLPGPRPLHNHRRQRPNRGLPPRELRDLQLRVRAEQRTPEWKSRYAARSGVEGTINEFVHGHGMRAAAATAGNRKPTCNTYSRPSQSTSNASAAGNPATKSAHPDHRRLPDLPGSERVPRSKSWRTPRA